MYSYRAFGFHLSSELCFPELQASASVPEVTIRLGSVPESIDGVKSKGVRFQASDHQFLLWVDGIARYLVTDGKDVVVQRLPGAGDDEVRLFLLGSVVGALLHQRGVLPLHGATIEANGGAATFVGPSGVGKSTLAAALCQHGFRMLCDDITAVRVDAAGVPMVEPGYPQFKIWADAAKKLGEDQGTLRRVRPALEKFGLPTETRYCHEPRLLRRVYLLSTTNTKEISLDPVTGVAGVMGLVSNTYRFHFLPGDESKTPHLLQCSSVAERVEIGRLVRPRGAFMLQELADMVKDDLS